MTDVAIEARLTQLATELEHVRLELRAMQAARSRSRRAWALPAAGLLAVGVLGLRAQPLSGQALLTHVTAPFVVEDTNHHTIFEVNGETAGWGVNVYGPAGLTTRIGTTGDGAGSLLLMAAGQADPKTGQTAKKEVVELGSKGIRFFGMAGGKALAVMDLSGDAPRVAVFNTAGEAVAALKVNSHQGGTVAAGDAGGHAVFQAGFTGTEGAACINTAKRGEQCLAIGLPLQR